MHKLVHIHAGAEELGRDGLRLAGCGCSGLAATAHRTVINFVGDGDFLMTGQELATAAAYGAKLISIVVDNGSCGTIRMHEEREYPGCVSGGDLFNPDFALLGRAYGWESALVTETAQLEPALSAALANKSSTLLHLRLSVEVSTSRATLGAIGSAARARSAG